MGLGKKLMFVRLFVFRLAQAVARLKYRRFQCPDVNDPWNASGSDKLLNVRGSAIDCGIQFNAQQSEIAQRVIPYPLQETNS